MKFNHISSLQHIALVRMAVDMWNNNEEVIRRIQSSGFGANANGVRDKLEWAGVVKVAHVRASTIFLPPNLKNELKRYVQVLAEIFLAWLYKCIWNGLSKATILASFQNLHFTNLGKIDSMKVCALLVADTSLNKEDRFKLACECCMEKEIMYLWQDLDHDRVLKSLPINASLMHYWVLLFLHCNNVERLPREIAKYGLGSLGISSPQAMERLDNTLPRLGNEENRHFYYGLYISFNSGNIHGIKYFSEKLQKSQNDTDLLAFLTLIFDHDPPPTDMHNRSECFCYLLSLLSGNSQLTCLKDNLFKALRYFVPWPYNNHFKEVMMSVLFEVWENSSPDVRLALRVVKDIVYGNGGYLYLSEAEREIMLSILSINLWPSYKRQIIDSAYYPLTVGKFLIMGKAAYVKILHRDMECIDSNYVHTDNFYSICNILISRNEWFILKLFLLEKLPGGEEPVLHRLIDSIGRDNRLLLSYGDISTVQKDKTRRFLANLNFPEKRGSTGENSNPIKIRKILGELQFV